MPQRVVVIGLGLIGGSVAGAAKAAGWEVVGIEQNPAHARQAVDLGLVSRLAPNEEEELASADLAVLAVPIEPARHLVVQIDGVLRPGAVLMDTASVKEPVVQVMQRLPRAERAVGGHPIAGRELSGPSAAQIDLFHGRTFALCPSSRTSSGTIEVARDFAFSLGARPVVMSADEHDRLLAASSHLPQLISSCLAAAVSNEEAAMAGTGLRDMTRLAASDPLLWRDIFWYNRSAILAAARRFGDQLEQAIEGLEGNTIEPLAEVLERGRQQAAQIREKDQT